MNRKLLIILMICLFVVSTMIIAGGCGSSTGDKEKVVEDTKTKSEASSTDKEGTQDMNQSNSNLGPDGQPVKTLADFPQGQDGADVEAVIRTSKGDIVIQFHPGEAPVSTAAFIQRSREGGYNGTSFHRVVPGFVVQGGDPKSLDPNAADVGTGNPGYFLPAEFNNLKHETGTVAMARSSNVNSGGCQFYICLAPQPSLNGQYTVFGETISGMDVVQQIVQGDVINEIVIRPKTQ